MGMDGGLHTARMSGVSATRVTLPITDGGGVEGCSGATGTGTGVDVGAGAG